MKSLNNLRKEEGNPDDTLVAYILYDLNSDRTGGKLSVKLFRETNHKGGKDYNGFYTGFFRDFEISVYVSEYVHPHSEIEITGAIDIYNYDMRSKFFAALSKIMKSRLPGMNFAQQIVYVLEAMEVNTMIRPNSGEYMVVHGLDKHVLDDCQIAERRKQLSGLGGNHAGKADARDPPFEPPHASEFAFIS